MSSTPPLSPLPVLPMKVKERTLTGSTSPSARSPSDKSTAGSDCEAALNDLATAYRGTSKQRIAGVLGQLEQLPGKLERIVALPAFGTLVTTAVGRGRMSVQEAEAVLAWLRAHRCVGCAAQVDGAYLHVAKSLAHRGSLEKAELLMVEMSQLGVPAGPVAAQLFDVAVRTSRFDRAWWMLERAVHESAKVDKVAVSLLLKRGPHTAARLQLVEHFIAQHKQEADEVLFNSLLAAYCRAEDMASLERVVGRMMACGVPPSAATFGTLIKAYGARGDFSSVRKTWEGMKAAGIGMNSVTYGCMLDAAVRCKQFAVAETVFQELRDAGMHRNTILFSTMIKAYAKRKDLDRALELKAEMLREQVPLNCVTYNSLIDVAVRCREYKAALGMLDEMEAAGLKADLITYSTLIKGLTDLGMLSEAMQLFVQVEQSGFKVDEILVNSLLDGCVKARAEPEVGLALLARMRAHRIAPSQVTLAALMKVFAVNGDADGALEFLGGCVASEHVLSTLVKTLTSSGYYEQACGALLSLGPLPLALHAAVLPQLVANGLTDKASCLLQAVIAQLNQGVPRRHGRDIATAVLPVLHVLATDPSLAGAVTAHVDQLAYLRVLTPTQVEQVRQMLSGKTWPPAPAPSAGAPGEFAEFVPGQMWTSGMGTKWWQSPPAAAAASPCASPKRCTGSAENLPENTPHGKLGAAGAAFPTSPKRSPGRDVERPLQQVA